MDAIEKAVRNALEKGDAEDKNYRRRVYVSARHALEKSMAGKTLTQDTVDERFSRLTEVAAQIESEFSSISEEISYPSEGRRSYEAPPPLVEEAQAHEEPENTGELGGGAVYAETDEDDLEVDFAEQDDVHTHPAAEVTAPEPQPETPLPSPKQRKKSASLKKQSKKTAVVEEAPPVTSEAAPPDLFEQNEPDWDEVSIAHEADPISAAEIDEPAAAMESQADEIADADEFDSGDLARLDGIDSAHKAGETEYAAGALPSFDEVLQADAEPETAAQLSDEVVTEKHMEVRPAADGASEITEKNQSYAPVSGRRDPERGWAFLLILITLLAMFVMGLWFALTTGALKLRGSQVSADNTVTVDPRDAPDPEPAPAANQKAVPAPKADDWMMIFRPENPGDLVVDPTISANVTGSGPLAHLRIEPAASGTGEAAVVFTIGKGVLEQIAGKNAVFDVVAAADDGQPTQISVLCDFAGLGDCGRKRFQIDGVTSDNLFQIEFPAGQPDGAGQIILNPDVDGKGRALEIYAIKVRVAG